MCTPFIMIGKTKEVSEVPETCISAQLVEIGKPLKFQEFVVPEPQQDEIVIKLEAAGVCRTDVHLQNADWKLLKFPLPVTLGHEGVGRVVKLGSSVTSIKLGDRVCTAFIHKTCRECEFCLSGNENVCNAQDVTGGTVNGAFSEYMIGNASFCRKVPESLSSVDAAPITCAGLTAYKAIKQSGVQPGEWVTILGASGGLGHFAVQYAKHMGMKVIGVGGTEKIDFIKSLGCDVTIDSTDPKLAETVNRVTDGGSHGVVTFVPVLTCVQQAVEYVRKLGTIVCVGLPEGSVLADTMLMVVKQIVIRGSVVGTRKDLDEALKIAGDGHIKSRIDVRKFKDVNEALDDLGSRKISGRIVLEFP